MKRVLCVVVLLLTLSSVGSVALADSNAGASGASQPASVLQVKAGMFTNLFKPLLSATQLIKPLFKIPASVFAGSQASSGNSSASSGTTSTDANTNPASGSSDVTTSPATDGTSPTDSASALIVEGHVVQMDSGATEDAYCG